MPKNQFLLLIQFLIILILERLEKNYVFRQPQGIHLEDKCIYNITRRDYNSIDVEAFEDYSNKYLDIPCVKILDLSINYLGTPAMWNRQFHLYMPPGVFKPLHDLEELYLNDNCLYGLDTGIFDGLINLKILNLADNYLITLEKNIFNGLDKLESLDLRGNMLTHLPGEIFDYLPHLSHFFYWSQHKNGLSQSQISHFNKIVEEKKGTIGM